MKRLFAAALAVSFILYLAACGGGAAASSPKDAVATMLDAMKNADTAKMKTVMTKAFLETDQAQKEPTEEERNQMKEMFKAYTWEVGEETIAEDGNRRHGKRNLVPMRQGRRHLEGRLGENRHGLVEHRTITPEKT